MSQGYARQARIGVDLHVGETLYETATTTFAKADYPGLYGVRVRVQAGGGGGGGVAASGTTSDQACSGGGGAGGHSEAIILAADLSTSETVTVGAGGAGGAAGENPGSAGGSSSFGSHCSATGGSGGEGMTQSTGNRVVNGGDGGVGTGGDLNLNGGNGLRGYVVGGFNISSGHGGDTVFGPGGKMKNVATIVNAVNPGTGGAGSSEFDGNLAGGNGAAGIVIIEVLYERKIAVDEDIHPQYLHKTNDPYSKGIVGYSRMSGDQGSIGTTFTEITDLTTTVETEAGRLYKVTCLLNYSLSAVSDTTVQASLGIDGIGFTARARSRPDAANRGHTLVVVGVAEPGAGTKDFEVFVRREVGTGTITIDNDSSNNSWLIVEDMGLV